MYAYTPRKIFALLPETPSILSATHAQNFAVVKSIYGM
jgi:hypothetical protein